MRRTVAAYKARDGVINEKGGDLGDLSLVFVYVFLVAEQRHTSVANV